MIQKTKYLTVNAILTIEEIIESGKSVEIAVRNGKLVIWAVSSKKKLEKPIV